MINSGSLKYFFLVELGPHLWTTYASNLTMTNAGVAVGTFQANSGLVGVDPPRLSSVVDREAYKITLADPDFSFRSNLTSLMGRPLVARVGFINSLATSVVGADGVSVAPGLPFMDIRDTAISYSGFYNGAEYAIEPAEGNSLLTITGSSPMSDLDAVRSCLATPAFAAQIRPGDTTYDESFKDSKATILKWGKK